MEKPTLMITLGETYMNLLMVGRTAGIANGTISSKGGLYSPAE